MSSRKYGPSIRLPKLLDVEYGFRSWQIGTSGSRVFEVTRVSRAVRRRGLGVWLIDRGLIGLVQPVRPRVVMVAAVEENGDGDPKGSAAVASFHDDRLDLPLETGNGLGHWSLRWGREGLLRPESLRMRPAGGLTGFSGAGGSQGRRRTLSEPRVGVHCPGRTIPLWGARSSECPVRDSFLDSPWRPCGKARGPSRAAPPRVRRVEAPASPPPRPAGPSRVRRTGAARASSHADSPRASPWTWGASAANG